MKWKTIAVTTSDDKAEALEEIFWSLGALSVSMTDAEDAPIFEPGPGETPLWANITLTAMFEETKDLQEVLGVLKAAKYAVLFTEELGDRVWEREWLARFKPMQFGNRLWVCPTGYKVDEDDAVVMDLDPGLAFGTGTHATTYMCLNWLDKHLKPGIKLLDYGCGSGILGIAGLLLGAVAVDAVDNDPQALVATIDNASRNNVNDMIRTFLPEQFEADTYALVVANILAQPLVDLAPALSGYLQPGGDLVLSGIMQSQADWVINAYDLELIEKVEMDGWVCLHLKKSVG